MISRKVNIDTTAKKFVVQVSTMNDSTIDQKDCNVLQWNSQKRLHGRRSQSKPLSDNSVEVRFKDAVSKVFLKSVFGTYLHSFNSQQTQDKFLNENKYGITIWDVTRLSDRDKKKYKMFNKFVTDDMDGLLKEAVRKENCIDWGYLYEKLLALRMDNNVSTLRTHLFC